MSYPLDFSLALGAGNTGLTLEAQLVDTSGANVGSAVATGFVEFGASGNYLWNYASIPDGHRGGVIFRLSGGGTVKAFAAINPQETENADVKTSAIAAAVWAYVARTLTTAIAAVTPPPVLTGNVVTIERGDTLALPFVNLGSVAGRTKLWFTAKKVDSDPDPAAMVQIEETAGLITLNGAPATSGNGSLVVTNAGTGNLTVNLAAVATAVLNPASPAYGYDIQVLNGGAITTLTSGLLNVTADRTRATS